MTEADRPLIVGTGASAVAVAAVLIARGLRPIMLDGGITAERDEGAESSATLEREDPGAKTWFGSDFATRSHPSAAIRYTDGVKTRASAAVGGLSRIWGGTFAFYSDFSRWPAEAVPADEDVALVKSLVPASVTEFAGRSGEGLVAGSQRSRRAMTAFERLAPGARWKVQSSEIAIDSRPGSEHSCTLLGVCLSGCPRDSIWYAGDQIRRWARAGDIDHVKGALVERFTEADGLVTVYATGPKGPARFESRNVFVAAGPLSTAAILIRSGVSDELTVRDTSTAFAAMAQIGARREPAPHHGLSQWWAKSKDASFAAQVYPPDKANSARVAERLPAPARLPILLDQASRRLHPIIAYLDSDKSDSLILDRSGDEIRVRPSGTDGGLAEFRSYLQEMSRIFLRAGYVLPVFATQFTSAGTGYHSGASVPHGVATDALGRLRPDSGVHIVDSSVLPHIQVGSITPTVMANAARIGRQVGIDR